MAPANDEFDNRIPIADTSFPVTVMGANVDATTQADEQQLADTGATVWWSIVTPEDGTYTIDTLGSDYDTQLHIYALPGSGLFADLIPVVNNDDIDGFGGPLQSGVTFQGEAGQCYEIRVGGFGSGTAAFQGDITLNVDFEPGMPFPFLAISTAMEVSIYWMSNLLWIC